MKQTMEEIFGKNFRESLKEFTKNEFLEMPKLKWKWTFDDEEKGRMKIVSNVLPQLTLSIVSRESGKGKVWTSHTGKTQHFENNSKFKDSVISTEWNKIFLSVVENYDSSGWKSTGGTYEYEAKILSMPLQFSIERLDHKYDLEYYPHFFGKYSLEIMGTSVIFETLVDAQEGVREFFVLLAKNFKPERREEKKHKHRKIVS